MKSLKFVFITLITISSVFVSAQEKLAATSPEKTKSAKVERAFSIIEKGSFLTKASFRKDAKSTANVIEIEAVNVSGGSVSLGNSGGSLGGAVMPPATITDITSISGNFLSRRDVSKSGRGVVLQLLDVNYPYRGRINVSDQVLEFEITEPGFWKISVAVGK